MQLPFSDQFKFALTLAGMAFLLFFIFPSLAVLPGAFATILIVKDYWEHRNK